MMKGNEYFYISKILSCDTRNKYELYNSFTYLNIWTYLKFLNNNIVTYQIYNIKTQYMQQRTRAKQMQRFQLRKQ